MGAVPVPKVMLNMRIPMILSMVLQACYNIVDSMFVALMLAGMIGLELLAKPLAGLFAMSERTEALCVMASRIIAAGFLFAGGNIAMQGIFQALGCGLDSLIVSLLRLCSVVLPLAWLFARLENAGFMIWWAFPIAELAAFVAAASLLSRENKRIIKPMCPRAFPIAPKTSHCFWHLYLVQ